VSTEDRAFMAAMAKHRLGRRVRVMCHDGEELEGLLRSMTLNGPRDDKDPHDPVTIELSGVDVHRDRPIALGRIADIRSVLRA
jgi:hypothetical protein